MKHCDELKLLIKFPTRQRPEKFFRVLDMYYEYIRGINFEFIISCDKDDISMNNPEVIDRLNNYPHLKYFFGENKSKMEAINNDMKSANFDILLLASDDMQPVKRGYDNIIKNNMLKYFSDTDGVLWFNDGFQKSNLNTLVVCGKKYYDRFKYIYNPEYKSLYCDKEFTEVSINLGKVVYFEDVIIKHVQYSIIKEEPDSLYIRNDNLASVDLNTYNKRKMNNFPVNI